MKRCRINRRAGHPHTRIARRAGHPHTRIALPLVALTAAATACQSGDAPAEMAATFTVEDSAGIEIVESSAPAWDGDGWTVADEPRLSIGRTSGDERYLFGHIAGVIGLPDGRVAVLDQQAAQVRLYSPEGEHLEDWGGEGEGPGEFNFPWGIHPFRGDSVLVSEFVGMGLSVFDDRGRFGRRLVPEIHGEFRAGIRELLADGSVIPSESCCRFWGPLSTGAFLFSYPEMIPTTGSGMQRGTVSVAIIADSGGAAIRVGDMRGRRYLPGATRGSSPTSYQFPLWYSMTAGRDGYFATEGDTYSISEHDANGRLRRIIRLAREPRPVTDDVKAAHEAWLREWIMAPETRVEGGDSNKEPELQRMLAEPYPPTLPTFYQLHVDPDGNIWAVQMRHGAGDDGRFSGLLDYFVFGPDGRHLGVIALPDDLVVHQIGSDYILGVVRDELEVQYVHVYAIEKG